MDSSEETSDMLEKPAKLAVQIFKEALESVKPKNLLMQKFILENDSILKIETGKESWETLDLKKFNKINVVGNF